MTMVHKVLAAALATSSLVVASDALAATTLTTSAATYSGLGSTNCDPYDQVVMGAGSATLGATGSTITLNKLTFNVGFTGLFSVGTYTGTLVNTGLIGGTAFSYTVPYTLLVGYSTDAITLLASSFTAGGYSFTTGQVTLKTDTSITGSLNATVTGVPAATPASPVPEPAAWAMMILGMGAVGVSLRRRQQVRVAYAA